VPRFAVPPLGFTTEGVRQEADNAIFLLDVFVIPPGSEWHGALQRAPQLLCGDIIETIQEDGPRVHLKNMTASRCIVSRSLRSK